MLQQHLQIFLRKLIRRDTVTYINIIGLSVGLACSILILIWIKNELTYDNFHSNYQDIYRIELTTLSEGVIDDVGPITMPPIGPALVDRIMIAFLLAIPLAWIILNKWLMNFAYATEINLWTFGLAGFITLAIAWLTISWHTIKAARRNPVDALRYE